MRYRRVGREFDRAAETGFRLAPSPVARVGYPERVMSFLQQRVQLNGPFGRRAHFHQVIWFGVADACQVCVPLGETGIGRSEGRVFGDNVLEWNGTAAPGAG